MRNIVRGDPSQGLLFFVQPAPVPTAGGKDQRTVMKWMTHQTAAVGTALLLHLPLEGVLAACLGAVLPDMLDQQAARLSRNPQRAFNRLHRGATHWFGWWLALFLGASLLPVSPHWRAVALGLGFGGLSHVLLDMLTPSGVPLQPFSRQHKFSLKLCSTGSLGEYVFLAGMVILFALAVGQDFWDLLRRAEHWVRFSELGRLLR